MANPSPDSNGKLYEVESQFLLVQNSDQRKLVLYLQKWFETNKLEMISWKLLQKKLI